MPATQLPEQRRQAAQRGTASQHQRSREGSPPTITAGTSATGDAGGNPADQLLKRPIGRHRRLPPEIVTSALAHAAIPAHRYLLQPEKWQVFEDFDLIAGRIPLKTEARSGKSLMLSFIDSLLG